MAMGRRKGERQQEMWLETESLPSSPGHPFYERLNAELGTHDFDAFVEEACSRFYAEKLGRPSLAPGMYFRMLLVGYFERIDSERGIAWRCSDSLALRDFLGCGIEERPPDHSTVSRTRRLIDVETHEAVFVWVLRVLGEAGLVKGQTIGIDATTLEANAALRSIIRRDTGERYDEFLEGLAKASGIETPTRQDLAKLDRKRKKKTSNDDWQHPHDPDAQVTKMKDGRTHEAHKDEHAVDLDTGAIVAVTLHGGAVGDTSSVLQTLVEVEENIEMLREDGVVEGRLSKDVLAEVVMDKGYHSNDTLVTLQEVEYRTYISEPDRGRRNWKGKEQEKRAVYANRRRIRGNRGKRLLRLRGELLERPFAHYLDGGGMRRTHLRRTENIFKRLLIHVAGFNLGLLMRKLVGCGTPRGHQGGNTASLLALRFLVCGARNRLGRTCGQMRPIWGLPSQQRRCVTHIAYAA
jgi:transposase